MYRFLGNISLTSDSSLLKVGYSVPLPSDPLLKRNVCSQLQAPCPGKGCSHLWSEQSQDRDFWGFQLCIYLYTVQSQLLNGFYSPRATRGRVECLLNARALYSHTIDTAIFRKKNKGGLLCFLVYTERKEKLQKFLLL